jgi:hypothetical protein
MSYEYYDESDFFHEPSEFEQQMDELKESLLKSVKKDYIDEMERLKKENEELQEVKKNMKNLESEHRDSLAKLNRERQDLEYKVRRERISSLVGGTEYFTTAYRSKPKTRCGKCDDGRIRYKTPSGKDAYEYCECHGNYHIYEPIPIILSELSIRDGKGCAWYKVRDSGRYDEYLEYYGDSISGTELIKDEKQFEGLSAYKTLFETEELAQKFCDLKNKESEEKS